MKEYIRTTHNFNNTTRTWEYRGNKGEDKYEVWNLPETREKIDKILFKPLTTPRNWSIGVHALRLDRWMDMKWILWETTNLLRGMPLI